METTIYDTRNLPQGMIVKQKATDSMWVFRTTL